MSSPFAHLYEHCIWRPFQVQPTQWCWPADQTLHCMSAQAQLDHLRADIRAFRESSGAERVVVLWTANTERYSSVRNYPLSHVHVKYADVTDLHSQLCTSLRTAC